MVATTQREHFPSRQRPRGLKIIIAYKAVKAPLVLALAVVLTLNPEGALRTLEHLVRDLSEGGALLGRLAHFIDAHLTRRALGRGALLAWLDGLTTSLEAFLLWRGKAWGEWIVVIGLATLVPFELDALLRHLTFTRLTAVVLNTAVVVYLVRLRLNERRAAATGSSPRAP
jgi:uncharacterized membrane protein (DUF2068 family)